MAITGLGQKTRGKEVKSPLCTLGGSRVRPSPVSLFQESLVKEGRMRIELQVFEGGKVAEMPVYESHRRGRNWVAVLGVKDGKVERKFVTRSGRRFHLSEIPIGAIVEIGADYYTGSGNQQPKRLYLRYLGGAQFELVGVRGRSMREQYPEVPTLENGDLYKFLAQAAETDSEEALAQAVQALVEQFGLEAVAQALGITVECPRCGCVIKVRREG